MHLSVEPIGLIATRPVSQAVTQPPTAQCHQYLGPPFADSRDELWFDCPFDWRTEGLCCPLAFCYLPGYYTYVLSREAKSITHSPVRNGRRNKVDSKSFPLNGLFMPSFANWLPEKLISRNLWHTFKIKSKLASKLILRFLRNTIWL